MPQASELHSSWPLEVVLAYCVGPGGQAQVTTLGGKPLKPVRTLWSSYLVIRLGEGGKCLYLLSQLTGPIALPPFCMFQVRQVYHSLALLVSKLMDLITLLRFCVCPCASMFVYRCTCVYLCVEARTTTGITTYLVFFFFFTQSVSLAQSYEVG